MKNSLDSREEIAKIDLENILGSVEALPDQCLDAWSQTEKITLPDSYRNVRNVVMTGMGGSGLGARIFESLYSLNLKVPFIRIHDYNLPDFVDENSLVICSSHSGTTEETVQNAKQALMRKAKLVTMGTGNTLIELATSNNIPFYKFDAKFNPSNQPRMTTGYQVVGQMVLLSKAGIFDFQKEEIDLAVEAMRKVQDLYKPEVSFDKNPAKKLATLIKEKLVIFISSGHLVGATHAISNQMNENSKNFSFEIQIPELNHHFMEGLSRPEVGKKNLLTIFISSNLYPERIRERHVITNDVVKQNDIEAFTYVTKSSDKLSQAFEEIQFFGYVNLYLAVLYGINPAPIPWVDYFKTKLGQPLGK